MKVKISGKRLIDKKVKSFDGKDLGKIKSITPQYVEIKDDDKRYFVPKVHIKEHDKDLFVLLMRQEVKDKYEREDPPLSSEVEEAERTGEGYNTYHEVIPFMAREPGLELKGQRTGDINSDLSAGNGGHDQAWLAFGLTACLWLGWLRP